MRRIIWISLYTLCQLWMFQCFVIMFPDSDIFTQVSSSGFTSNFTLKQRNFPMLIQKENDYILARKLLNGIDTVIGRYNHYLATICTERMIPYFVLDKALEQLSPPLFDSTTESEYYGKFVEAFIEKNKYQVVRFVTDSSASAFKLLKFFKNLTRGQCNLSMLASATEINNCVNTHFKRIPQKTLYILAGSSTNIMFVSSVLKQMLKCTLQYDADILTFGIINSLIGTTDYGLSGAKIINAYALGDKLEKDNALATLNILKKGLNEYKVVNETKLFKNGTEIPFSRTFLLNIIQGLTRNSSVYNGLNYVTLVQTKTAAGAFQMDQFYLFNQVWTKVDFSTDGLRVGYYENILQLTVTYENTDAILEGLYVDLLDLVLPNTKKDYILLNENSVGRQLPNTSYTGALGQLFSGTIQILLFPTELIRAYKNDFLVSESIYQGRFSILIKKASKKLDFFKFVKPYSILVWLILLVVVFAISIIIFLINAISTSISSDNDKSLSVGDSIFYIVGSFLIAKMLVKPNMFATQIFYVLIWLGTLLLIASYVANLTVILIFQSTQLHTFTTFDDLNDDKRDYKFVFVEDSHLMNIILNEIDKPGPNKSIYLQLYEHALLNWPEKSVIKSTINIDEFLMKNPDTGIINDEFNNLNHSLRNCNLTTLIDESFLFNYVYVMKKNLNFKDTITSNLINARENGALNGVVTKYLTIGKCNIEIPSVSEAKPFDLEDLSGVFILILIGLVLAFPVALIEYLWKKGKLNHQRKNMGTPLQFGKVYSVKVTGLDKHGIYVHLKMGFGCCGVEDIVYIRKENLSGKKGCQGDVPSPIEQGITVGANLKVKYLGTLPNKATRSFMQVNK